MGTSRRGREPVSAVLGLAKGARSMTTLNVPGSVLCEVAIVWASTVEKERERVWAVCRRGESWKGADGCSLAASSLPRSRGSFECAVRPSVSLLAPGRGSRVALSGGVCAGKTKASCGCGCGGGGGGGGG
jgi:hypothetical protein